MELREAYTDFLALEAEVVAVAVAPITTVQEASAVVAAPYPMLSDSDHRVSEAYGVYNLLGDGFAGPATFVVGPDGRVRWAYLGADSADRPAVGDILAQLR